MATSTSPPPSATGLLVSSSVGPIGVDFGHASGSWTHSTKASNNYPLTRSYPGFQFDGTVLTVSEHSQVTADFGATASFIPFTA
jgi:hypothetical protein